MQRQAALGNLALAFILIFGTAFSCGPGNNRRVSSTKLRPDRDDSPTRNDSEKTDRATGDLSDLTGGWLYLRPPREKQKNRPA